MRLIAVGIAALVLTGCADRERAVTGGPSATNLVIKVHPEGPGAGPTRTHTVACPGSSKACAKLKAADLAPLPAGQPCTRIYGGPAEATVRGSLKGRGISVRFSLSGGCEIDRWRQAAYLLGDPPGE